MEMQVTGLRTIEDNFWRGWGSPTTVTPKEEEEEQQQQPQHADYKV